MASASPRRRELLAQIGIKFCVHTSDCDETMESKIPSEVVSELSRKKAQAVFTEVAGGNISGEVSDKESGNATQVCMDDVCGEILVVGADTVVAHGGEILGKPSDREDAIRMLRALSGDTHEVYTGVTFCYSLQGEQKIHTFYEKTEVVFFSMSEEEILDYVDSPVSGPDGQGQCHFEWEDKAGSYAVQGRFAKHIKGLSGDYYNVVGLPVGRLYQELKECGLL